MPQPTAQRIRRKRFSDVVVYRDESLMGTLAEARERARLESIWLKYRATSRREIDMPKPTGKTLGEGRGRGRTVASLRLPDGQSWPEYFELYRPLRSWQIPTAEDFAEGWLNRPRAVNNALMDIAAQHDVVITTKVIDDDDGKQPCVAVISLDAASMLESEGTLPRGFLKAKFGGRVTDENVGDYIKLAEDHYFGSGS